MVYNGQTERFQREGHGVLYGNDTLIEYEGKWANDKFNGEGRQYN